MRLTRTIILLAGTALAVMAMSATTASAQETEVEVLNERTGAPCDPSCGLHLSGESRLVALPSGVPISECEDDLEGTILSSNFGEVRWTRRAHGGPGCTQVNCAAPPGEDHWSISNIGETRSGEEHVTLLLCMQTPPSGPQFHCLPEIHIADTEPTENPNHHYEFDFHALCANGARELEGRWLQETLNHDAIELVHHPVG